MARHRRWVVAIWALLLVIGAYGASVFQGSLSAPTYLVEGSESAHASSLISRHMGDVGEQDALVFHSDRGQIDQPSAMAHIGAVLDQVRAKPWVTSVVGPADLGGEAQISADRRTAYAIVGVGGDAGQRSGRVDELTALAAASSGQSNMSVEFTGFTPLNNDLLKVENDGLDRAEMLGVPIALLVLLLALGSVTSATVPLVTAGMGSVITFGILGAFTPWMAFDSLAPAIATMVGLGVGIDYSMFIVSRFREEFVLSGDVVDAAGRSMETAGRTVLASGVVVVLSLGSLAVVRSHLFREMALAASMAVVGALVVALTLLPAILAMLGRRLAWGSLPPRFQPPRSVVVRRSRASGRGGRTP